MHFRGIVLCSLIWVGEVCNFGPLLLDSGGSEARVRLEDGALAPLPSYFSNEAGAELENFARRVCRRRGVCNSQNEWRDEIGLGEAVSTDYSAD